MSNLNSEPFGPDQESPLPSDPLSTSESWGRPLRLFVAVVVVIVVVGGAGYAASLAFKSGGNGPRPSMLTHAVQRGEMLVTVTEDGNVESAKNVEIKCQVAGGTAILSIVKDGTEVKKGDKLVELDASQLDDQINAQKITYEKARSALVQAEKDFQVAEISVKEYLEGTY